MKTTAKLFTNGSSQAVRLPAEYRFEGTEVSIRKDETTGDVILSPKIQSWDEIFAMFDAADIPEDFMSERDNDPLTDRGVFDD